MMVGKNRVVARAARAVTGFWTHSEDKSQLDFLANRKWDVRERGCLQNLKTELRMELPLTEMGSGTGGADSGKETRDSVWGISLRCPHVESCHTGTEIHSLQFILPTKSFS